MTPQAKNRILAYLCLGMMAAILISAVMPEPKPQSATVMLPKAVPEYVTIAEQPSLDKAEFECMRQNIYHEAGNQGRKGMEVVALVTLTRTKTKHFPDTICKVAKAKGYNKKKGRWECAFSWYCDGKSDAPVLTIVHHGKRVRNVIEERAWAEATAVAEAAMRGELKDFTHGATHYYANYVSPSWADGKRIKYVMTVGDHLLYRDTWLRLKA